MKTPFFNSKRLMLLAIVLLISPGTPARAQDSFVRILHGLALTGKIDISIDGEKRFNDFEFGGLSRYLRLDNGPHSILIQTNNPTRTVLSIERRFKPYDFHTLGIYGTPRALRVLDADDSNGNPAFDRAQLTAYNLSPGSAPFDVVTFLPGGPTLTLLRNVRYGHPQRANIPAFSMTVRLVRRGRILKTLKGASPRAGRKYALYAIGRESRNFKALLDVTASQ